MYWIGVFSKCRSIDIRQGRHNNEARWRLTNMVRSMLGNVADTQRGMLVDSSLLRLGLTLGE